MKRCVLAALMVGLLGLVWLSPAMAAESRPKEKMKAASPADQQAEFSLKCWTCKHLLTEVYKEVGAPSCLALDAIVDAACEAAFGGTGLGTVACLGAGALAGGVCAEHAHPNDAAGIHWIHQNAASLANLQCRQCKLCK